MRLQRLCVEYEKLMADSAELSEKNQTLKTSCDAVISILDVGVMWHVSGRDKTQ